MKNDMRVAIIGLDTSHSIEFTRRMLTPSGPSDQRIHGLKAVSCLRFDTPFQNTEGLNTRQAQLEEWGVPVTTNFEKAVADCNAIMLEINDASYHLAYFKKVASLGKPVFLDKPLAGNITDGKKILSLAKKYRTRVMSCSSLRFNRHMLETLGEMPSPLYANFHGVLGKAPAGDSLIWYGVHTFEMLERAMGKNAVSVYAVENKVSGITAIVNYPDNRQGIIELRPECWYYAGRLAGKEKSLSFHVDSTWNYYDLLLKVKEFFEGAEPAGTLENAYEILALMQATRRSIKLKKAVKIRR